MYLEEEEDSIWQEKREVEAEEEESECCPKQRLKFNDMQKSVTMKRNLSKRTCFEGSVEAVDVLEVVAVGVVATVIVEGGGGGGGGEADVVGCRRTRHLCVR
jgi:hypothetical protein